MESMMASTKYKSLETYYYLTDRKKKEETKKATKHNLFKT